MNQQLLLAIDQSTSGTKVLLVNETGEIVAREFTSHQQIYPQAGWVEHDPVEIYSNVRQLLKRVLKTDSDYLSQIRVLGITNQRETVVVWDKRTGLPVYNAIVWQCRRTSDSCAEYKQRGYGPVVQQKTGLTLDPYFSATKVKWILDNVEGARENASAGHLAMGTIDTWLIWNLTKGMVHATDYSNASRTLLFNIYAGEWDQELLSIFGIPEKMLPRVYCSDDIFGHVSDTDLSYLKVPISGVIGDSQAALFGQKCFERGLAKATYGTGTSVLMHTGERPIASENGLVTSVAWGRGGKIDYALEGIIHSTGDTLAWVREGLGIFSDYGDAERLAETVKDNNGVYLIPAFLGLGAPYWDPFTRAAILGINRNTTKAHIIRAAFESIAYQVRDVTELMRRESNLPLKEIRVDGGGTKNRFLMQFQAELIGVNIIRSDVAELSAMGCVYLAGMAVGIWKDTQELQDLPHQSETFTPRAGQRDIFERLYEQWKDSVQVILSDHRQ
jgi:glycerol kinase